LVSQLLGAGQLKFPSIPMALTGLLGKELI
jgi:hypothetical protein